MKALIPFVLLIILLLSSSCIKEEMGEQVNIADSILNDQIEKNKTPGLQYYFFDKDSVIYSYYGGLADIETKKEVIASTTFNAYSVTKTFTALAILQLYERGLLNLDDPVSDLLTALPYPNSITIRQLLTHTSGIPNPLPLNWTHTPEEHQDFDRNHYFEKVFAKHSKTKAGPNEKFSYSNLGYIILGQVIEQISGLSYEKYIHDNVLRPLSIDGNQLDFTINNEDLHATAYLKRFSLMNAILGLLIDRSKYKDKTAGKWTSYKNVYVNGTSYGGLVGNASGFILYLQELLKDDNCLITEDSKRILFTENILESGKNTGMCLSWFKGELNGKTYYAHAGGGFYYCEIRIYPELGKGSVIMFNRSGMSDLRFLDRIDTCFLESKQET